MTSGSYQSRPSMLYWTQWYSASLLNLQCIDFLTKLVIFLSWNRVFSLFTFQMASQFPKHDNHSAEHVWFCVCFISDLSLSQWITNTFWQHHRECSTIGHGSYGSWVKYSVGHMGHGSLEVTHRLPWQTALSTTVVWAERAVRPVSAVMFPGRLEADCMWVIWDRRSKVTLWPLKAAVTSLSVYYTAWCYA